MAETFPTLDEPTIRARFDPQSWQRGKQYARNGAIFNPRRQGMTIKADCSGSLPEPYRVQVTFDRRGIADADCSCPVGDGGYCKHTVALLLAWLHEPETFTVVEDVETALERRDKPALIALIKQMLRHRPELEMLLETPLPGGRTRQMPVTPEAYRKQVAAAFRRGGYEWGAEQGVATSLNAILAIGDGFSMQGDAASAATVYAAVSTEMLDHFSDYQDENGALSGVIIACIERLERCLTAAETAETRATVIDALLAIYHFDMALGGYGMSDAVPDILVAATTADERRMIARRVRESLPGGSEWGTAYRRQGYGAFLLDLEAETLDDEAYLHICRETGRTGDLIERLLTLGCEDEAIEATGQASDYEMIALAEIFVRHGAGATAERLMLARAATTNDTRVLEWLKSYYAGHGDTTGALTLAERIFRMRPDFAGYRELRDLARKAGTWDALHDDLLTFLTQSGQVSVLVAVYLDEGEIDRALDCVLAPQPPRTIAGISPGYYFPSYGEATALMVAKAAEETRPERAREIYERQVERLIAGRNRDAYRQAAGYLVTMRELYDRTDEYDRWERYLAALREKYRTLRALKEEMASAGLLD